MIPSPSAPVRRFPYVYVGGGDGRLYEIDITVGPASIKSLPLGDLAPVGAPSLHVPTSTLYVGSESGAVYAVQIPLP